MMTLFVDTWFPQREYDKEVMHLYFLKQNITARITFEKPDDPLQFMLDEIEKVKKGEKLAELK